MKITQFFAALILSIFLFSCTEATETDELDIYGTWTLLEYTCDDGLNIQKKDGVEYERDNYSFYTENMDAEFIFNDDNTLQLAGSGGGTMVRTTITTINGIESEPVIEVTENEIVDPDESTTESTEFIIEGNEIKFVIDEPQPLDYYLEGPAFIIEELTEETLVLSTNPIFDISFGDLKAESSLTLILVFEKKQ